MVRFSQIFKESKSKINPFLHSFLRSKSNDLKKVNRWGADLIKRLDAFVSEGKMGRGSMVLLGIVMMGGKIDNESLKVASALELIHSALLIQDDIMDRDPIRRGKKTLYAQYEMIGIKKDFLKPLHFGEGMATCVSDLNFFYAFELLSSMKIKDQIKEKLISTISLEISRVALGQMHDLYLSESRDKITISEIINLYRFKTARYTFSLPLILAALYREVSPDVLNDVSTLGELLGLIYQIKDDEIGLFESTKEIGKPIGSDVRENKKTIFYIMLFNKAANQELKFLKNVFGADKVKLRDIHKIKEMIIKYGIKKETDQMIETYIKKSRRIIDSLPFDEKYKRILGDLLEYSKTRTK